MNVLQIRLKKHFFFSKISNIDSGINKINSQGEYLYMNNI